MLYLRPQNPRWNHYNWENVKTNRTETSWYSNVFGTLSLLKTVLLSLSQAHTHTRIQFSSLSENINQFGTPISTQQYNPGTQSVLSLPQLLFSGATPKMSINTCLRDFWLYTQNTEFERCYSFTIESKRLLLLLHENVFKTFVKMVGEGLHFKIENSSPKNVFHVTDYRYVIPVIFYVLPLSHIEKTVFGPCQLIIKDWG